MTIDRRTLTAGLAASLAAPLPALAKARSLPQPDPKLWDPQMDGLREGMAEGPNGSVYYRVYGKPGRTPVIVLHGGPAGGHRYMRPYAALATDRQVVLYDQSGCGQSAQPTDFSKYTVERYVAELEALRSELGFKKIVLLGHSWGGFLAPAYAAAHPERVAGLVLAGSAPRWLDFEDAAGVWLKQLGPAAVRTVAKAKATGRTDDPAYGALTERYYALHLCRLHPSPAWFDAEGQAIGQNKVYAYLNGPTEFQFTGALQALSLSKTLRAIRAPTLITCGEFDEAPPWIARKYLKLMPRARLQVFDGLSHMSHVEDPARVTAVTGAFVKTIA